MTVDGLTRPQLAYLAGLIDGEGSIECQRENPPGARTPRFSLRLSFAMATAEPIRTVAEWLDLTAKRYPARPGRHPCWRLHVPKGVAVELLRACEPYLILKRDQAGVLLAIEDVRERHSPAKRHVGHPRFQPMPVEAVEQMEQLHRELRDLKAVA